jgi:predicted ATP-grasp superfamily ATP-dependent carboligase
MTTVLIGFAESLAAIESAWCLADAGYDVVAFTRAGNRPALAASRHVRVVPVPAPEEGIEACVEALRAVAAHEKPDALLPLDDHSVLLADRLQGIVPIAGPTGALARIALDKREQLALAEKAGFPVPPTVILNVGDQPEVPDPHGPWIVKCALATVVDDDKIRRPGGGIARTMPNVANLLGGIAAPSLIQPVIDGAGEGLFGIAIGGLAIALSAHQRIRMMNPRGSGSSAARSIPVDPDLAEAARRFVETSGWHGIFMLEFLRDRTGRPWFMELNGRTWGSMALARHRGWPYPVWAVKAAIEPGWVPEVPPEGPHRRVRHLGREIVHLLAVLRGPRGNDKGRWPTRRSTVVAMLRPERGTRWYHWRRGEFRVLLRDTWTTVMGQVRKGS